LALVYVVFCNMVHNKMASARLFFFFFLDFAVLAVTSELVELVTLSSNNMYVYSCPLIVSRHTAALSHRELAAADTSHDNVLCRGTP
jgi:hypothetical protein